MELHKKGKIILLVFIVFCVSSCAGGRGDLLEGLRDTRFGYLVKDLS